jgi:hypothetical protein
MRQKTSISLTHRQRWGWTARHSRPDFRRSVVFLGFELCIFLFQLLGLQMIRTTCGDVADGSRTLAQDEITRINDARVVTASAAPTVRVTAVLVSIEEVDQGQRTAHEIRRWGHQSRKNRFPGGLLVVSWSWVLARRENFPDHFPIAKKICTNQITRFLISRTRIIPTWPNRVRPTTTATPSQPTS